MTTDKKTLPLILRDHINDIEELSWTWRNMEDDLETARHDVREVQLHLEDAEAAIAAFLRLLDAGQVHVTLMTHPDLITTITAMRAVIAWSNAEKLTDHQKDCLSRAAQIAQGGVA